MSPDLRTPKILIADDDEDDRQWLAEALLGLPGQLQFVRDGEELMDCLHHRGSFAAERAGPSLILLDLNMPKKDGRQALQEIKAHPQLRRIPVVILTTSQAEEDVLRSYELGASTVVRKPSSYQGFLDTMQTLARYWFEVAALPA